MCLAVPAEVIEVVDATRARVRLGGVVKEIALHLVEDVAVGDYLLMHVGFALGRIDAVEAQRTLEALQAAGEPLEDAA